tara:strand:- start:9906 stop:10412 length:507 start_codon:yes stop_codon:yes gene_type:complete
MTFEIKNRVAESRLVTIDFNDFLIDLSFKNFDIKCWLKDELILIEKDFRKNILEYDWSVHKGENVCIICSNSAIIPDWAYMLVSSNLTSHGIKNFIGNKHLFKQHLIVQSINSIDLDFYKNKPVIIKGCSDEKYNKFIYSHLIQKIQGVVKRIMYGEACSSVPIFKKK